MQRDGNLCVKNGHHYRKHDSFLWKNKDGGGYLFCLEQGIRGRPQSRPSLTHSPVHSVGIILRGEALYRTDDGKEQLLNSGWCFQEQPDTRSSFIINEAKPYRDWLAGCDARMWEDLVKIGAVPRSTPLWKTSAPAGIEKCFRRFFLELESPSLTNYADGFLLFASFLKNFRHDRHSATAPLAPALLKQACAILENQVESSSKIPSLLAPLGVPYDHLRKAFAEHYGISPAQYQIRARITTARKWLEKLSVAEVAERLGYADGFAFSKQFKRSTGMSPSIFKNKNGSSACIK